jgi:hypothetical protein
MTIEHETQRVLDRAVELVCSALDRELDDLLRLDDGTSVYETFARLVGFDPETHRSLEQEVRRQVWRPVAQGAVVRLVRSLLDAAAAAAAPRAFAEADLVALVDAWARDTFARRVSLSGADAARVIGVTARVLLESDLFAETAALARAGARFSVAREPGRLVVAPL